MAASANQFNIVLQDIQNDDFIGAVPKFLINGANLSNGEQDAGLIDVDIGGDALIVQANMAQVVHGTMVEDGSPATLVVFQFAFVPRGNNRRFKEVEITMTLCAGELHFIAPQGTWAAFRSEKEQELSHSVSPGMEATVGLGNATLGYTWQLKETKKIESHARITESVRSLGHRSSPGRKWPNTAFWGMYENKQTRSGTPSFLQTAVLIKRSKSEKFSAEIKIQGEVDRLTDAKDTWESIGKKVGGRNTRGEDVIFNTKTSRGDFKDVNNLKDENLEGYQRIITVRDWADGAGSSGEEPRKHHRNTRNKVIGRHRRSRLPRHRQNWYQSQLQYQRVRLGQ